MLRRIFLLLLVTCTILLGTGCGLFHQDPGLNHLKEKYPDYTFEFMASSDNHGSYKVDGFDYWVTVRAVENGDDYVFYDNFLYLKYRDQILESQAEILTEICSRLGTDDFNICIYGGEGWMRDGILTSHPSSSMQTVHDNNTEVLSFEEFMSSPESNNEFIGVIYVQDAFHPKLPFPSHLPLHLTTNYYVAWQISVERMSGHRNCISIFQIPYQKTIRYYILGIYNYLLI